METARQYDLTENRLFRAVIEADAGMIAITGTVESMMDAGRVVMIVRKNQGVKDIHLTCASAIPWSSRHNN